MTSFVNGIAFSEAVKYATSRNIILPDEYYGRLIGVHRAQSVSVAGLASLEQIRFIVDELSTVMANGGTFKSFQDAVKNNSLNINLPTHRLDNIFRTNIQAAYSRGRWEQQMRVRGTRPFLMYDAINDSRVRPAHGAMDNIVRQWDDSFWRTNYPPNGYRCRCTVISLSEAQALKRGLTIDLPAPDTIKPDLGWEYNPGEGYTQGPNVALANTVAKIKVKKPRLSKKVEIVAETIKEAATKAGPATLDEIMELGHAELAKLPLDDPVAFDAAFEKLLFDRVIGVKATNAADNKAAIEKHARDASKGGTVSILGSLPAAYTKQAFLSEFYSSLPLPKSWLQKTSVYFKDIRLKNSERRAYADQYKKHLSFNVKNQDVILHEYLHFVQVAMPEVETLCREMHLKRTAGATQKRLKTVTGNSGFSADEVTREDNYFNAYMGKEYYSILDNVVFEDEPLEILTMVFQALIGGSNTKGKNPMRNNLLKKDKESAAFGLGLLLRYA